MLRLRPAEGREVGADLQPCSPVPDRAPSFCLQSLEQKALELRAECVCKLAQSSHFVHFPVSTLDSSCHKNNRKRSSVTCSCSCDLYIGRGNKVKLHSTFRIVEKEWKNIKIMMSNISAPKHTCVQFSA